MGAGGSVQKDAPAPQGYMYPCTGKQKILSHWQKRQLSSNIFAVARHDERADAFGTCSSVPTVNGANWIHTDDFAKWPYDPPLSDTGVLSAGETGQRLSALAAGSSCQIHVVISSQYWRCVQTAVEICRGLGPNTRLLIDRSLGEVYGPSVMGETEPACPVRPLDYITAYCKSRGVHIHQKVIGTWPTWPEKLSDARKRFANRFLKYLHRGAITKRNFMLVTHADGVGACLSIMPSQLNHTVDKIEYGGLFSGTRQLKEKKKTGSLSCPASARGRTQPQKGNLASIVPCDEPEGSLLNDKSIPAITGPDSENWLTSGGWLDGGTSGSEQFGSVTKTAAIAADKSQNSLELPHASDGWQVLTHRIDIRTKRGKQSASGRVSQLSKTMKSLGQGTGFNYRHIEKLLGDLSENPLGNDHELAPRSQNSLEDRGVIGTMNTLPTQVSQSTFLFGDSDVGNMSDCMSDCFSGRVPTIDELIPTIEDLKYSATCQIMQNTTSPRSPVLSIPPPSAYAGVSQWTSSDAAGRWFYLLPPPASDAPRHADPESGTALESRTSTLAGSLASSLRQSRRTVSDDRSKPEGDSQFMAIDQSGSSIMARRRLMALTAAIEKNDGSNAHAGPECKQMPSGYGATHMALTQMPPRPPGNPGLTLRRNISPVCQFPIGVDQDTPNENDSILFPLSTTLSF